MKYVISLSITVLAFFMNAGISLAQDRTIYVDEWLQKAPDEAKGKLVYLDFWATWCRPCIESMPHTQKIYESLGDKVVFVALTKEPKELVRDFVSKKGWELPIALDFNNTTHKNYEIRAIPSAFVLSPGGGVLWQGHPNTMTRSKLKKLIAQSSDSEKTVIQTK